MSQSYKWVTTALLGTVGTVTFYGAAFAQPAPAPEGSVPPPTIDSNEDGKPDAWDRDGKPDRFDNDGDGKPDDKSTKEMTPK
jgi:hypothetical protein